MNKTLAELRKEITKKYREGSIVINNIENTPEYPSKVFRRLKKDEAIQWLNDGITWKENYGDDGEHIFSETPSDNSDTPSDNGDTPSEENKESKEKPEPSQNSKLIEQTCDALDIQIAPDYDGIREGSDMKVVTDLGLKSMHVIDKSLQVSERFEEVSKAIRSNTGQILNETRLLENRLKEAIKGFGGGDTVIKINDVEIKRDDKVIYHTKFEEICNFSKMYKNVMLVGEAGTGKTTVAEQVADAFDLSFKHLSCSAGMSEAHLLGRMVFDGSYIESEFVNVYENGGVFLFDEFDAMDGNCAVVINSALANGTMSVPNRRDNPIAKRHKDCIIIVACNTWATGNGSRLYAGRNRLDGATLDRFCTSKIYFTYDKKLERYLGNDTALCEALWMLRARVKDYKLDERIISTRLFVNGNIALQNGIDIESFLKTVTVDWTREEKGKVDLAGIIRTAKEGK